MTQVNNNRRESDHYKPAEFTLMDSILLAFFSGLFILCLVAVVWLVALLIGG